MAILEGFYGANWSWQQRRLLISLMHDNFHSFSSELSFPAAQFNQADIGPRYYCYAPKSDDFLRKHWQQPLPSEVRLALEDLSLHCQKLNQLTCDSAPEAKQSVTAQSATTRVSTAREGLVQSFPVALAIGLSPIGLYDLYHSDKALAEQRLIQKIHELVDIGIDALGLFFDDMQGDLADLALIQSRLCELVLKTFPKLKLFFCPSYYSADPVLPKLFGDMPPNYWEDLGELLPSAVQCFWTGGKVITEIYDGNALAVMAKKFKRPLTLWDNSGVNDGRLSSPFLPLDKAPNLSGLGLGSSSSSVSSLWMNPSNAFSVAVLQACRFQHNLSFEEILGILPQPVCKFIQQQERYFTQLGREQLSDSEMSQIKSALNALKRECHEACLSGDLNQVTLHCLPLNQWVDYFIQDIEAWLAGDFRFDPECLT